MMPCTTRNLFRCDIENDVDDHDDQEELEQEEEVVDGFPERFEPNEDDKSAEDVPST